MPKVHTAKRPLRRIAWKLGLLLVAATPAVWGQPVPALRAVVSAEGAPGAMSALFTQMGAWDEFSGAFNG